MPAGRGAAVIGSFRRRPETIEGMRYDGDATAVMDWIRSSGHPVGGSYDEQRILIPSPTGVSVARPGDWVLHRVIDGRHDFWPVDAQIFDATYLPAPQIDEPVGAPSVAELMEQLNNALGHSPLGAEPIPPQAVWERLLAEVREHAPGAFARKWQDARDAGAIR